MVADIEVGQTCRGESFEMGLIFEPTIHLITPKKFKLDTKEGLLNTKELNLFVMNWSPRNFWPKLITF